MSNRETALSLATPGSIAQLEQLVARARVRGGFARKLHDARHPRRALARVEADIVELGERLLAPAVQAAAPRRPCAPQRAARVRARDRGRARRERGRRGDAASLAVRGRARRASRGSAARASARTPTPSSDAGAAARGRRPDRARRGQRDRGATERLARAGSEGARGVRGAGGGRWKTRPRQSR